MNLFEFLADSASNPIAITAEDGAITYNNNSARSYVRAMRIRNYNNIYELCPGIRLNEEGASVAQSLMLCGIKTCVRVFSYTGEEGERHNFCVFRDTPVSSELLSQVLEAIDEGITVIDAKGFLETANELALHYIGMGLEDREQGIGDDLHRMLIERGFLDETIGTIAIKERKTVKKNLEYKNGKVLTYTATPVFDDEGELSHVVLTGRDVSRLVQLESQLNEMEKLKNDYYSRLMKIARVDDKQGPVCTSKKMEYILGLASKVAPTDAPIFLTGESGVGKEEVARFIHRRSGRCDRPFVAVNCAAIPEQLVESELFGFAGGSFTGANRSGKKGLLEEANGGTFFLDEIGELPFPVQSKLLRVVQEGQLYRIGGTTPIGLDVRYISATNRSEDDLGNTSKFRRDLYYRLSVVPIHIPPLRERTDDIIPLVSEFLESYNVKYRKKIKISNKVLRRMTRLEWPGNVRELRNVVERLVIISNDGIIVDEEQLEIALDMDNNCMHEKIKISGIMPLSEAHDILDNILINEAYSKCGSIVEAAKLLRIDPSTIHRKIKDGKISLSVSP